MQWEENSLKLNMNLAAYLVHNTYISYCPDKSLRKGLFLVQECVLWYQKGSYTMQKAT